jgi:NlpC/P60 family
MRSSTRAWARWRASAARAPRIRSRPCRLRTGAKSGSRTCGTWPAAYATAGIDIPCTADAQWRIRPAIPAGQPVQPGDLLFYGTPLEATHVTIYIGNNRVIDALQGVGKVAVM